jgi:hypothetical protein
MLRVFLVLVMRMRLHLSVLGFRFRNVVMKLNCSGNPWLNVRLDKS